MEQTFSCNSHAFEMTCLHSRALTKQSQPISSASRSQISNQASPACFLQPTPLWGNFRRSQDGFFYFVDPLQHISCKGKVVKEIKNRRIPGHILPNSVKPNQSITIQIRAGRTFISSLSNPNCLGLDDESESLSSSQPIGKPVSICFNQSFSKLLTLWVGGLTCPFVGCLVATLASINQLTLISLRYNNQKH